MNRFHKTAYYFVLPLLLLMAACTEVIEPSLNNVQVQLVAPADHAESTDYLQTFYWEPTDAALKYQFQLATPDFDAPVRFVLDSSIKGNKFTYSLSPGKYQWRVRAVNGSSQSAYVTRNISIDTASLSRQAVQLTSPGDNFLTNNPKVVFSWQALFSARKYKLQADDKNFGSGNFVLDQYVTTNTYAYTLQNDGTYQWRVRAENDTAVSQYSPTYTIILDRTPPAAPVLKAPQDNLQNATLPLTLEWSGTADVVKYMLYVYKNDGTTLFDNTYPQTLTGTSVSFNKGSSRDRIYWQVKAIDAAGNESTISEKRNFTLQ
ncbi:fibronectin type III domain-containing protein [Chitinophaga flava]|uniref:Fibronectin type-III domain-containing protein n=1 Tax=Chitinophaga flava TaxID=2259036 RepID=A0A365Y1D0_9BACT|nr:hypothetical protein [Chitinophaga flava]RBL91724.1 hypothetical protein DF182_03710 [Chitinophaga flava]